MNSNDLKLDNSIFRFLFASSAHFVGECDGSGFYLTPAFSSWGRRSPSNRLDDHSTFVLSLRTEPGIQKSIRIETFDWVGEEVSALLGAFYGKLIHNLGHIQSGGIHRVPETAGGSITRDRERMPFNSDRRRPDGPLLNLSEAKPVIEKYLATQGEERVGWILRAAEFYRVALESFHSRPEVSLAMFCSTLEALLPLREYSEDELYDESLASEFEGIATHCPQGDKIVRDVKSRLYQIKRKVAAFVAHYVPDSYFEQRETANVWGVPKDRADLISRVKCIYDLRSKVVHTGDRRGLWYLEGDLQRSEIGLGSPVTEDNQLKRTLVNALTLTGMERVTSTVLRTIIAQWIEPPNEVGPPDKEQVPPTAQ